MNIGDAFLMSVPPNFDRDHLFFVISDPAKNSGTFVIVNVTTNAVRAGRECVLQPCDHSWIRQECFVSFTDALEITPQQDSMIQALVGTRVRLQDSLSPAVVSRIVDAAKNSKAIPTKLKKYL